ncbi:MAG: hypothetical protein ABH878_09660 [bacterium]
MSIQGIDWNDLLRRIKEGDSKAKNLLLAELQVRLRPILKYRLWGHPEEDVDDLLQDILTILSVKINYIHSNPDKYALKILRNVVGNAYQRWRKQKNISSLCDSAQMADEKKTHSGQKAAEIADKDDFKILIETKDLADYIRTAIKQLPTFCQTLFLAILEGRQINELWRYSKKLEPDLKRSAFDKRIHDWYFYL